MAFEKLPLVSHLRSMAWAHGVGSCRWWSPCTLQRMNRVPQACIEYPRERVEMLHLLLTSPDNASKERRVHGALFAYPISRTPTPIAAFWRYGCRSQPSRCPFHPAVRKRSGQPKEKILFKKDFVAKWHYAPRACVVCARCAARCGRVRARVRVCGRVVFVCLRGYVCVIAHVRSYRFVWLCTFV